MSQLIMLSDWDATICAYFGNSLTSSMSYIFQNIAPKKKKTFRDTKKKNKQQDNTRE